jgi:hypothetical protein
MHRNVKHVLTGLAAAALLVGTAQTSASAHGGGGSPPRLDSIVGNLVNNPNGPNGPLADFQIIAVSKPDGSDFVGAFRVAAKTSPVRQYIAVLTCMRVAGNLATVVGKITWSTDPERPAGTFTRVRFEDVGRPSTYDKIQIGRYFDDPTVCPDPAEADRDPITSGFLSVIDLV